MPGGDRGVAIVGMACVMPGAPDLETFWANIVDGVDSVTEVPSSRWNPAIHFDPDFDSSRRRPGDEPMSVSKWGGWVPDVGFDALAWGIPPASLASIDPAQLLALKVAGAALDDAGYGNGGFDRERASVVYATGSGGASDLPAGFLFRLLLRNHGVFADALPPELDAFLPQLTEDGLPGVLTSVIAGRVANRLDLGGKNLTVDSACASVLVALDIARNELAGGSSDLVLCGGVDLHNGAQDYVSFTAAHALSRSGRCRSFDVDADGMTLAEGVGCLVLKRVEDAERDGDRVYAVLRGVAGSSDGRHLGLTAPRQEGQERAVRRAYDAAGLSPTEIGLVEAHGTGTPTGDRTELSTTTAVFAEAGVEPGSVVIGSVKSNIGHIKCAAGVASLIKAAKAAYHGVLPPTLHVSKPNEVWDPATSPFVFLDQARPWLDGQRRVAVSSFGFGGTNFHAILENHAGDPPSGRPHWPSELFAFRAATDAELHHQIDELAARLAGELAPPRQADRWRLRDIAASISAAGSGESGPVLLAVVADDLADLASKLQAARNHRSVGGVYRAPRDAGHATGSPRPAVAFLFPGPSSARPGMTADILAAFPSVRETARRGRQWTTVMLPPQAFREGRQRQWAALSDVEISALPVASLTLAHLLATCGVTPDRVAGCASPLLATPADAAVLSAALQGASPGDTAPPSVPLADGPAAAGPDGGRPRAPEIAVRDSEGHVPVPGRDGEGKVDGERKVDREAAVRDEIRQLAADGVGIFVEVGPGSALTGLVERTLADVPHLAVAVDQPGQHGITSLLHAVAQLVVAGIPVELDALHRGRGSDPDRWTNPQKRPEWIVNGHFARRASGEPLPKGLRPADQAPPIHIGGGPAPVRPTVGGAGQQVPDPGVATVGENGLVGGDLTPGDIAVVTAYLRIVQRMMLTGSEIIRGQAGAGQRG